MILDSILTCPNCHHKYEEVMLENTYQSSYRCPSCETVVKKKKDECCVFCSYGDYPCPQAQIIGSACCSPD